MKCQECKTYFRPEFRRQMYCEPCREESWKRAIIVNQCVPEKRRKKNRGTLVGPRDYLDEIPMESFKTQLSEHFKGDTRI